MLKRVLTLALALLLLVGASSCGKIEVKDTFTNGLKWGNTLAAEQGDWVALRARKNGNAGVALYNQKTEKIRFLQQGEVYHIAMLGNKVYVKYLQGSELYCYDIESGDFEEILSGVMAYQIHGNTIYYITDEHSGSLYTYNLETKESGVLTFKHTVDAFWITDYAIYYHDDGKDLLIVKYFEKDLESIIYRGLYEHCRDVVALNDTGDIAFMINSVSAEKTTLCTYEAETATLKKHFTGYFTHYNLVKDRLVTVNDNTVVSVDYATGEVFDWGSVEGYYYPQILSDCLVLYDEDGNLPTFRPYPKAVSKK